MVGKIFGPNIKEFQTKLENLTEEEINKLNNNESIKMNINGEDYCITSLYSILTASVSFWMYSLKFSKDFLNVSSPFT